MTTKEEDALQGAASWCPPRETWSLQRVVNCEGESSRGRAGWPCGPGAQLRGQLSDVHFTQIPKKKFGKKKHLGEMMWFCCDFAGDT